jgi:hypothetical protein
MELELTPEGWQNLQDWMSLNAPNALKHPDNFRLLVFIVKGEVARQQHKCWKAEKFLPPCRNGGDSCLPLS